MLRPALNKNLPEGPEGRSRAETTASAGTKSGVKMAWSWVVH